MARVFPFCISALTAPNNVTCAQALLSELGVAKQVMGGHEGRELVACKAKLKDITNELVQAHNQQRQLEVDRDKSEASLLQQLQTSCRDLALVQKQLSDAEGQNITLETRLKEEICIKFDLQRELDSLRLEMKGTEDAKQKLEAKLHDVWRLAAKSHALADQESSAPHWQAQQGEMPAGTDVALLEAGSLSESGTREEESGSAENCITLEAAAAPRTLTSAQVSLRRQAAGRASSPGDRTRSISPFGSPTMSTSAEVHQDKMYSPSSIVDGLQRHIRQLMQTIQTKDLQHERLISGMHDQKAKLDWLVEQQTETVLHSVQRQRLERQKQEHIGGESDEDVTGLSQGIDELQKVVQQERAAHAAVSSLRDNLDAQVADLRQTLQIIELEHGKLQKHADDMERECERLQESVVRSQTEMNAAISERGQARQECEVGLQRAMRAEEQNAVLSREMQGMRMENERLQLESETCQNAAESDQIRFQDMQRESELKVLRLEEEKNAIHEHLQQLQVQCSCLQETSRSWEDNFKESELCVSRLEGEKKALHERLSTVSADWEASKARMEGEQKTLGENLRKTEQDNERLEAKAQALAQQLDHANLEHQVLVRKLRPRATAALLLLSVRFLLLVEIDKGGRVFVP